LTLLTFGCPTNHDLLCPCRRFTHWYT